MVKPLFFCTGILRSGSTWSFNVCRLLGQALSIQRREPFGSAYLLAEDLEQFLKRNKTVPIPGPTVLKTHTVGPIALEYINTGKARAICTFRDPRDCVVSMRTFFGGDFNEIAIKINAGFEFLKLYHMSPNTLFVRYEDMITNPIQQIGRIALHMNVPLTAQALEQIDQQTNIQSSQIICEDLKNRNDSAYLRSGSHRVDPITNLHDNHIQKPEPGRWRDELTDREARFLNELFRPWLLALGYETPESLSSPASIPTPANTRPANSHAMA